MWHKQNKAHATCTVRMVSGVNLILLRCAAEIVEACGLVIFQLIHYLCIFCLFRANDARGRRDVVEAQVSAHTCGGHAEQVRFDWTPSVTVH